MRIFFSLFFFVCFFSCKKEESLLIIIKENFNNKKYIKEIFKKNNIITPENILLDNNDYYFPLARIYYNSYGYDEWSTHLFNKACNTDNIFKDEATNYYISILSINKCFTELKLLIKNNSKYIDTKNLDFLLYFYNDEKLDKIENIPEKEEYFQLVYEIIKRDKETLFQKNNLFKLIKYFSKISFKNSLIKNNATQIYELIELSQNNPFLLLIYYYILEDIENFSKYI
ncbi:MAG TPA: hypothetical protein PK771_08120 [Spirochaetota bacterium]|nr:hypothetical protein [Spirochaetota bacterium]